MLTWRCELWIAVSLLQWRPYVLIINRNLSTYYWAGLPLVTRLPKSVSRSCHFDDSP